MISLGEIKGKQIWYSNLRNDHNWQSELPDHNWVAFTITDDEDMAIVDEVVRECLNRGVSETCSTGDLAHYVEDSFDWVQVEKAIIPQDGKVEKAICTTAHRNFSEGFWYAAVCADNENVSVDKVVCLDFTTRGVRQHLVKLTEQINNSWLPNDDEVEKPVYDE